jgi:hypothetical protein
MIASIGAFQTRVMFRGLSHFPAGQTEARMSEG